MGDPWIATGVGLSDDMAVVLAALGAGFVAGRGPLLDGPPALFTFISDR